MTTDQAAIWVIVVLQIIIAAGLWRMVILKRQKQKQTTKHGNSPGLEQVVLRLEGIMNASGRDQVGMLADLREDLAEMRADIEWLASDRMISQAIDLARQNSKVDDITLETGLSEEAVRAIKMLRRH